MGSCVLREMGLESQEWSATRKAKLQMLLEQYREKEKEINQMMEIRAKAAEEMKVQRQKEVEKEVRRIQRGENQVDSDDDENSQTDEQKNKKETQQIVEEEVEESQHSEEEEYDYGLNNEEAENERLRKQQEEEEARNNEVVLDEEEQGYQDQLKIYFGYKPQKSNQRPSQEKSGRPSRRNKSIKPNPAPIQALARGVRKLSNVTPQTPPPQQKVFQNPNFTPVEEHEKSVEKDYPSNIMSDDDFDGDQGLFDAFNK